MTTADGSPVDGRGLGGQPARPDVHDPGHCRERRPGIVLRISQPPRPCHTMDAYRNLAEAQLLKAQMKMTVERTLQDVACQLPDVANRAGEHTAPPSSANATVTCVTRRVMTISNRQLAGQGPSANGRNRGTTQLLIAAEGVAGDTRGRSCRRRFCRQRFVGQVGLCRATRVCPTKTDLARQKERRCEQ